MAKAVPPNSRDKDAQYVLYSTVCLISICYMRCVSRCVGVSVFVCVSKLCSGVYYVLFVCNFTMHLAHTFYVIVCFFLLFLHVCKSWYAHCTHTHTHNHRLLSISCTTKSFPPSQLNTISIYVEEMKLTK